MAGNCIYPTVAGCPWTLVIGFFHFFWRRIMSLLGQIVSCFTRVGDGEEEVEGRDLDGHVPGGATVQDEREPQLFEKPFHVQKMTVKMEDLVTEFHHDFNELISHVQEFVVDSVEEKDGLVGVEDDCMGVGGSEMAVHGVSETIANAGAVIELYKSHLIERLEEEEEEEMKATEEDHHVGNDEDTSITVGEDELGTNENGPEVVTVAGYLVCNDISKNPCSETVHTVSDTEERGEKLQSHIQCYDEDPDGDAYTNGDMDAVDSGENGNMDAVDSGENRDMDAVDSGDRDAVESEPDTQGQEEEMQRIPNEEEHHLRFSDEKVTETTIGHGDALVQDAQHRISELDGCNDISENPCAETAQNDEPNESEHKEVLHGNVKDESSEDLGEGNASSFYEYEEDEDDEDHEFFIQKLKSDIRRLKGPNLSVIPEESESDLFDSSTWDSETEESIKESSLEDCSPSFRTLEPEEEESLEVFYEKYTERMRYFDMLNYQQIYTMGLLQISNETLKSSKPQGVAKRLKKSLTNKSQAKNESNDMTMRLQQGLETVYVGQTCLSWEALHWQYKMFQQMVLSGPEHDLYYDYVADQFQQFQVLLQRFLENEEFEGPRVLNYVKNRCVLRSFLHVPPLKGSEKAEALSGTGTSMVTATQLVSMMEESIVLFSDFVKAEKIKATVPGQLLLNFLCGHQELEDPNDSGLLRAIRKQLHSKELQVRELQRRGRCITKRLDPRTGEGLEILMALVDVKLVSRVLKMSRITTDHLQWCQKKLNKLSVSDRRVLHRRQSTVLFPI